MSDPDVSGGAFRMPEMITFETGKLLPEQEAYLYLMRAAQVLSGPVSDLFAAHNVSSKQYNALRAIRRAGTGGATVNQIRQQMTDPRADATRLIDRLERDGLVKREHDQVDRRVVRVILSEAGTEFLKKIDAPLLDVHRSQFNRLSPDDLDRLKEILKRIT